MNKLDIRWTNNECSLDVATTVRRLGGDRRKASVQVARHYLAFLTKMDDESLLDIMKVNFHEDR